MKTLSSLTVIGLLAASSIAMAQQQPMTPGAPPASPAQGMTNPPVTQPTPSMTAPRSMDIMTALPAGGVTVTNWYKQNVYDNANAKIGDISDVLVSPSDGKITAIIVGVGGFLGIGEKNVAVSFDAIKHEMRDSKSYLVMNTTKDALQSGLGFRYDSNTMTWSPDRPTTAAR